MKELDLPALATSIGDLQARLIATGEHLCQGQAWFDELTDDARRTCKRDIELHLAALTAALERGSLHEFAEYCAWSQTLLLVIGRPEAELPRVLDQLMNALEPVNQQLVTSLRAVVQARLGTRPLVTPEELCNFQKPASAATGTNAAEAIQSASEEIARMMVITSYMRRPFDSLAHGEKRSACLADARRTVNHLVEAVTAADERLFASYATWLRSTLEGLGIDAASVLACLECLLEVLTLALPREHQSVPLRCVTAALQEFAQPAGECETFLLECNPHSEVAREYLEHLLKGDRHAASELILGHAKRGMSVASIYMDVLQPVQYEVGRLWQLNQISIATEHFCTAATQLVMSLLYPRIYHRKTPTRRVVATCVGGNLHEVGLRIVADFFEINGWVSYYLGANMPAQHVVREIQARRPHAIAVSATLTDQLSAVKELIDAIRATPEIADTVILAGGYPFSISPTLARAMGADGSADEAPAAVGLAEKLLAERELRAVRDEGELDSSS